MPEEAPRGGPQYLGELSALPGYPQFIFQHPCLVYIQHTHKIIIKYLEL